MKFNYRVKNQAGEIKVGEIEAGTRETAIGLLHRKNFFIISIKSLSPKKSALSFLNIFNRISMKDKLIFTRQLAVMIESGFPVAKALRTLRHEVENSNFKKILTDVIEQVEAGQTLSVAMSRHTNVFDEIYIKTVSSGEQSGNLHKVLERLAQDQEKSYNLTGKIKSAMAYPAFILVALVGVFVMVMIFIMPQLQNLFTESGVTLPITTRMLLGISNGMRKYWYIILLAIIILIPLIKMIGRTKGGRFAYDEMKIKVPIFGKLNQKIYIARFVRTFSTLTSAGLSILNTFKILETVIGNTIYQTEVREAAKRIENGATVSQALNKAKHFPPIVIQLIGVGEQTGELDKTLTTLARFLESDISHTTKTLSALIEPVLMVVMGVGVGIFVVSVLMPIYGLVQVIK